MNYDYRLGGKWDIQYLIKSPYIYIISIFLKTFLLVILLFLYLYYWNLYGGYGDGLCSIVLPRLWREHLKIWIVNILIANKTYCIWCGILRSFCWYIICIIYIYKCMSVLDIIQAQTLEHTLLYITKAIFSKDQSNHLCRRHRPMKLIYAESQYIRSAHF